MTETVIARRPTEDLGLGTWGRGPTGSGTATPQDDNLDRGAQRGDDGDAGDGAGRSRVRLSLRGARRPADDARVNWRKIKKLGRGGGGGAAREIGGPRLHVPYNHGLLRV